MKLNLFLFESMLTLGCFAKRQKVVIYFEKTHSDFAFQSTLVKVLL